MAIIQNGFVRGSSYGTQMVAFFCGRRGGGGRGINAAAIGASPRMRVVWIVMGWNIEDTIVGREGKVEGGRREGS
jgi:hypothetical protein